MSVPPSAELEGLLADDRWIRRLAGRLLADPGAAEDLVQDTWVAALTSRRAPSRPWLGRVLRNTWKDVLRGRARRDRRERVAARAEATEPADELVAELELRERLVRALRELEEPYRRALYLRFFRDESLTAIARREEIAVSTAHERVERGLARMRSRLDDAHGGRREAWAGALITLAAKAGTGAGLLEVLTMSGVLKVAASVLVLGAGAALWWGRERAQAGAPSVGEAVPGTAVAAVAPEPLASEPAVSARIAAEPEAALSPGVAPAERETVAGRVLDVHGEGMGGRRPRLAQRARGRENGRQRDGRLVRARAHCARAIR